MVGVREMKKGGKREAGRGITMHSDMKLRINK